MPALRSLVVAALAGHTAAHGFLKYPPSRNYLAWRDGNEDCPHCYNGGTVDDVQFLTEQYLGTSAFPFPPTDNTERRHGVCGDSAVPSKAGEVKWEVAGGATLLEKGQVVDFDATITAHHKGHVEARLCKPLNDNCDDAHTPPMSCLALHPLVRKAGPGGNQFWESGDPIWDTAAWNTASPKHTYAPDQSLSFDASNCPAKVQSDGGAQLDAGPDAPPFDDCFPERAYLRVKKEMAKSQAGATDKRGWKIKFSVQLPADVECDHCVIQWTYQTSNSCVQPSYRLYADLHPLYPDLYPDLSGSTSFGMSDCGHDTTNYPEEFWNCADVSIQDPANIDDTKACVVKGQTRVATPCTERDYSKVDQSDTAGLLPLSVVKNSAEACPAAPVPNPNPQPVPPPPPPSCCGECKQATEDCTLPCECQSGVCPTGGKPSKRLKCR